MNDTPNIYKVFTILVVEDDRVSSMIACKMIKIFSPLATILKAYDGLEALEKMKQYRPDLIFMDINMPLMDGNEATKKIREYEEKENLPKCKIVGLSSYSLQQHIDAGMNELMDDYMTKPIDADKFKKIIIKSVNKVG